MSAPFELNLSLITKEKEKRNGENNFSLIKTGYHLYPIDVPITIRSDEKGRTIGQGIISKIAWEKGRTMIQYTLISLDSPN